MSFPVSPSSRSFPPRPESLSSPPRPAIVSAPAVPASVLAALLPVMVAMVLPSPGPSGQGGDYGNLVFVISRRPTNSPFANANEGLVDDHVRHGHHALHPLHVDALAAGEQVGLGQGDDRLLAVERDDEADPAPPPPGGGAGVGGGA
jgi:hypothetical protein